MYMPLSVSLSLAKTVLHFSFPAAEPGCKDQVPIPGLARRVHLSSSNEIAKPVFPVAQAKVSTFMGPPFCCRYLAKGHVRH